MTYSPGYSDIAPPMVSPFTFGWSDIADERVISASPASAVWETANRAAYLAILVPTTCVAKRLWWANGSTVSASYNVDVGIYLDAGYKPGTKLVSTGSTAQGTASQVQFVDITDTTLSAGLYWLGMSCSSGSATFFLFSLAGAPVDAAVRFQESSALPLPATASPVETDSPNVYLFGFATTASP